MQERLDGLDAGRGDLRIEAVEEDARPGGGDEAHPGQGLRRPASSARPHATDEATQEEGEREERERQALEQADEIERQQALEARVQQLLAERGAV